MPSQAAQFAVFDGDLSQEWASFYSSSDALAVDTEAMGLCHGRDRLCLVQIADRQDRVCCVRIGRDQTQAPRLQRLLESDHTVKVFHYARFDVAALRQGLAIVVQPIFCTKLGSRLARTYSPRHGLKDMIQELWGVELDKRAQSSDWGRVDQLTEQQLAYAANDVRFLLPAMDCLRDMLVREERWELAQRCFTCVPTLAELDRQHFGNIFEH